MIGIPTLFYALLDTDYKYNKYYKYSENIALSTVHFYNITISK